MKCGSCKGEVNLADPVTITQGCPGCAWTVKAYACTSCGVLHNLDGDVQKNALGKVLIYKDGEVQAS